MEVFDGIQDHASKYLATLAMATVCSYLGLFTVLRRIVFTGVALAQLAAAGVASSFFVADSPFFAPGVRAWAAQFGSTIGSLVLTLLGAFGLQSRPSNQGLSADALVGIVFAGSSALAILLVAKSARGLVELSSVLAGEILLIQTEELVLLWFGLIVVALIHKKFRREFLLVSYDPEFARSLGVSEKSFQLLLLGTLAVAIAFSLRAAGLLLVFSYLVLPPLTGLNLGKKLSAATRYALATSLAVTLLGFLFALWQETPVGPSISAAALAVFLVSWLGRLNVIILNLVRMAVVLLLLVSLTVAVYVFPMPEFSADGGGMGEHAHSHGAANAGPTREEMMQAAVARLQSAPAAAERVQAAKDLVELDDSRATESLVRALLDDEPDVRRAVVLALRHFKNRYSTPRTLTKMMTGNDAETRILAARALVFIGRKEGIEGLIKALRDEEAPPFAIAEQVLPMLRKLSGSDFGFNPFGTPETNNKAVLKFDDWWQRVGESLLLPQNLDD